MTTRAKTCSECGRPQPAAVLPVPVMAISHCDVCHVPFSLDEIKAMFDDANLLDSNPARGLRRAIVDDLITALRRAADRA